MEQQQGHDIPEMLSNASIFKGIRRRHLEQMANIGSEESFERGDFIFREEQPGDTFYLVLDGKVRISRHVQGMGEEALAILGPGAAFGEMALIDDFPRSADAVSHVGCTLLAIKKEDLEDLLFVDRDLAYEFLWRMVRLLSARLRETNDKMTFLSMAGKFE